MRTPFCSYCHLLRANVKKKYWRNILCEKHSLFPHFKANFQSSTMSFYFNPLILNVLGKISILFISFQPPHILEQKVWTFHKRAFFLTCSFKDVSVVSVSTSLFNYQLIFYFGVFPLLLFICLSLRLCNFEVLMKHIFVCLDLSAVAILCHI